MTRLHLDIETYSPVSIADCGNYKYAMHPEFRILLVAFAFDDEPVRIVDLASGEPMPACVLNALVDPDVMKVAHNAVFERVCFTMLLRSQGLIPDGVWLDPAEWDCTMARCARAGLPLSLAEAAKALHLEQQKMTEGKALIKKFCVPNKAGALFGSERVMPADAPEDWKTFKDYCVRDVVVERQIDKALSWVTVPDSERWLYEADQNINDRGVLIDTTLASQAARIDAMIKAGLVQEARALTGLSNPNSVAQLRCWLEERLGDEVAQLRKTDVLDIAETTQDPVVRRVMEIRQQAGKTSCAKYPAMLDAAGPDDRARGLLQFYGTRTGRWAGRLVQLQNLPQNHLPLEELDFARSLVREGDYQTLKLCFGNVNDTLSQLIRTALIAPEGKTFVVCDFSAIEARVLAWLAGEQWVLDTFRQGGDIYCATASQMFHVPVEKHGQNAELRQKGKIAVLALGYGGGVSALDAMGGKRLGMSEDEEGETVRMWRDANPGICRFWKDVEKGALAAITHGGEWPCGPLVFHMAPDGTTLLCRLPSGRDIAWPEAEETINRFGSKSIRYRGVDQQTNKWTWLETYGGKLTENITQAVARDCLGEVLTELDTYGHRVVFHVHDEVIVEVRKEEADKELETVKRFFADVPKWAKGLPLKGAGYITDYYLKD
ncbi:MAG: DNA polymerase [Desulfovibrio sp.]|nr:DNA polymerase [Desulfovibrio sp.]